MQTSLYIINDSCREDFFFLMKKNFLIVKENFNSILHTSFQFLVHSSQRYSLLLTNVLFHFVLKGELYTQRGKIN